MIMLLKLQDVVKRNVLIPRISSIPTDVTIAFKRLQFPIKLNFAMSINISQGQTQSLAGIQVEEICFSHGLLQVACSRTGRKIICLFSIHQEK